MHVEYAEVGAGRHIIQEQIVGYGDYAVIKRAQLYGAQANLQHIPILTTEADSVAHLKWPIKHDHHAGNQRCHKIARSEANGYCHTATDDREYLGAKVETKQYNADNNADVDEEAEKGIETLNKETAMGEGAAKFFHQIVDQLQNHPGKYHQYH